MHQVLAGYVERGEVPGMVTVVSRRGHVQVHTIGTKGVGGPPMDRGAIFRIASLTKPIIAAAAMTLVEECKLRLEDPVDRWLPELADRRVLRRLDSPLDDTVPAHRPITVSDLLTFRLGLGIVMAPPGTYPIQQAMEELNLGQGPPNPLSVPAPDEWMRRLGTLPLLHQPGEKWLYNTGSDVLGVLIARVADRPLETFLRERIFEPLGMKDTGFSVPAAKIDRLAPCYAIDPAADSLSLYDPAEGGQWSRPPAFPSGAGGLVSTADDCLAFGEMMLNQGRHGSGRILSRPAVELMTTDHLTPVQKAISGLTAGYFDSHGWGYGLSIVTRCGGLAESIGRFGWDGGLGTSWYADPREELTAILLTQVAWTSPSPPAVCRDFWTLVYQSIDD